MFFPKPCTQILLLMVGIIMVASANPYRTQHFKTMSMRGLGFWGNPVSVESDEENSSEQVMDIENPGIEDEMIEHVRDAIGSNQNGQHHHSPGSHTKPNIPNIIPGDHTKPLRPVTPNQQGQHHHNPGSHTKPNHPQHDVKPLGPAINRIPGDYIRASVPVSKRKRWFWGWGESDNTDEETSTEVSVEQNSPEVSVEQNIDVVSVEQNSHEVSVEQNSREVSVEQTIPELSVEQNSIEDQSLEDEFLFNLTQELSPQEIAELQQALALEDVSIEDILRPSGPGSHTRPILPPGHHTKPFLPQQTSGHYVLSEEDTSVEDIIKPQKPGQTPHGIHISPGSHTKPLLPPGFHTKPLHPDHTQALQRPPSSLRQFSPVARSQRFFWDSSEKPNETPHGIHISPGSHTKPLLPPGFHIKPLHPDHTQALQRPQSPLRQFSPVARSQRFFWDSSEERSSNSDERDCSEERNSNSDESDSSEELWFQQKPCVPQPRPHSRPQPRPTQPAPITQRPHPRPHTRPQPRPTEPAPSVKRLHPRPHPRPTHTYYTQPPVYYTTPFVPYNGLIV